FFFSSRRRHTRFSRDWSSDVCSSDLTRLPRLWLPLLVAASTGCSGEAPPDSGEPPGDLPIFARAPVDPTAPSGDDPTEDAAPNRSEERRVGKEWSAARWPQQPNAETT